MNCPGCGKANAQDATQCSHCGADLAEQPTLGIHDDADQPTMTNLPGGMGPALQPGERLGERYEILDLLGSGGFGAVYKAHDRTLDRTVALKVIHASMATNKESLERFRREILLASKITHKNVVRIHDLGEAGDLRFISMNFVEGRDLKHVIEDKDAMPIEHALSLIHQVAEALQAAHDAGVVHRDLKPQNILVDNDDQAYILDFGISRSSEPGHTITDAGALLGTLAYMSPEQARGEQVDHRSDIYSLGLIMFEMFTGSIPFQTGTAISQLMQRTREEVPSIDATRAGFPVWLRRIVARAVARDVKDRYQSVVDLLRDLDRQKATVKLRRRFLTRTLGGLAAVAVLAAVVTAGVVWFRDRPPEGAPPLKAEVILVPFRNVTRDPALDWTRGGLPDLLRSALQQSAALRVVGEERAGRIADGLKLSRDDGLDDAAIQRIAGILRVNNVVTADLFRTGDRFRIDARLLRVGASSLVGEVPIRVEGTGEDQLFGMIDELGRRLRDELGVSPRRGERRGATELTTTSVEALRLYTEGAEAARGGSDVEAAARLEQALEIDGKFASARALLAETYSRLGRDDDALREADAAAAALRDVSPYEFARVSAVRAALAGDPDAAETSYRELTALAPNRPEAFLFLGQFQEEWGDLEGALESLRRVVELDPTSPTARFTLGRVLVKLGRPGEGLVEFREALSLNEQSGNEEGRATVLNGFGRIYSFQGDYDKALDSYRQALEVRRGLDDPRGTGVALHNIALTQLSLGNAGDALDTQEEAIGVLSNLGDSVELADAYAGLGDIHQQTGDVEQATAAYEQGLRILRDAGDEAAIATALGNLGYIKTVTGKYNEAYFFQRDALEKRREAGDPGEVLFSLVDIGGLEQIQGRYEAALKHYAEGLELARRSGNMAAVAVLSINLGQIHHEQGDYGAALAALDEAHGILDELGDPSYLADCLEASADLRRDLGDLAGAGAALDEVAGLNEEMGIPSLEAEILAGRARLLLAQGRADEAAGAARDAVAAAEASGEHRGLLLAKLVLGQVAGDASILDAVLAEAGRSGLDPIAGRAAVARAAMASGRAKPEASLDAAVRAADAVKRLNMRDALFAASRLAGQALDTLGRHEDAAEHYRQALQMLEEMRRGLESEDLAHLLGRPATTDFAESSGALFAATGDDDSKTRLETVLTP